MFDISRNIFGNHNSGWWVGVTSGLHPTHLPTPEQRAGPPSDRNNARDQQRGDTEQEEAGKENKMNLMPEHGTVSMVTVKRKRCKKGRLQLRTAM